MTDGQHVHLVKPVAFAECGSGAMHKADQTRDRQDHPRGERCDEGTRIQRGL